MPHLLVEPALSSTAPWFPRLQRCLASRQWIQALRLLEHVIEDDLPLFDQKFYVGPPDLEARVELFRLYLADRPALGVDYLALGESAEGLTPADIREVVNEAARHAMDNDGPIAQEHVVAAVRAHPSWRSAGTADRRRIGF